MAQVQEVFLFTPNSLPGCLLWLDAADSTTITLSGTAVTEWRDKTSNALNFSNTSGTRQPVFSSTGFDGRFPSIVFTEDYLTRTTTGTSSTRYTVFFAVEPANTSLAQYLIDVQTGRFVIAQAEAVGTGVFNGSAWFSVGPPQAGPQIYSFVCTSGGGMFRNGTQFGTITTFNGLPFNGAAGLGSRFSLDSQWYLGGMSEVIFYPSALSQSAREQVEGYLAWKWGLVGSLPANHPFKRYRPLANPPIPTLVPSMPLDIENVSVFDPLSISGCLLWLDARDSSTLTTTSGTGTLATFVQPSPTTSTVTTSTTVPSLFSLASGTCLMSGLFINSGAGLPGVLVPSATTGDFYAFVIELGFCKVVRIRFTLAGSTLSVTGVSAGFTNVAANFLTVANSPTTNDTLYASYSGQTLVTSSGAGGYGVANFSLNFASVSEWRDKSTNAWHVANGTAATQPTYSAIALNGLPGVRFFNTWLSRTNTGTLASTTYTVFFMVNTDAIPPGGGAGYFLDVNTGRLVFGDNNIGGAGNPIGTGLFNGSWTTFAPIQTGIQLFSYVCTPGGALFRNGTFVGSFPSFGSIALNGTLAVGANRLLDGGTPYRGSISEILMYNSVLTTSQRQEVEGYLAWKYNTSSLLGAGQPYQNAPLAPFPFQSVPFVGSLTQWLPTQIPNTQLWLDASEPTLFTLTPGTATVTAVTDRNSPGKSLSVVNTVTYTARTAINFTDANGRFTVTGMPSPPYDFFFVGRALSSTATWRTLLRSAGVPGTHQFILETGTNRAGMWSGSFSQLGSETMAPNEQALFYMSMSSVNTFTGSKNGTIALSSVALAATNEFIIQVIGNSVGGQPFGELQELLVYSGTLTTMQRQQVEGYLAWKWGLAGNLPLSHPFKFFPPSPP
jgi:hypothetical protein